MELSVVVITKNEERHITRCLDSVLRYTPLVTKDYEVILVDSASSDSTLELAEKYPIRLYRLTEFVHLSAAAGKSVGSRLAGGDLILFLDGDMALVSEVWLKEAMEILATREEVAAVTGIFTQEPYDNIMAKLYARNAPDMPTGDIPAFSGPVLIKAHLLKKCGGWNEQLVSWEEFDLSLKLKALGLSIVRIKERLGHHYGFDKMNIVDILRKQAQYAVGSGQLTLLYKGTEGWSQAFREFGRDYLVALLWLATIFITISMAFLLDTWWLLFVIFPITFAYVMPYVHLRGLRSTATYLSGIFPRLPFYVGSFLRPISTRVDLMKHVDTIR